VHLLHTFEPVVDEYVPMGHEVQLDAPANEYVPIGHKVHDVEPYVPFGHINVTLRIMLFVESATYRF
jgi:hypothetical protein